MLQKLKRFKLRRLFLGGNFKTDAWLPFGTSWETLHTCTETKPNSLLLSIHFNMLRIKVFQTRIMHHASSIIIIIIINNNNNSSQLITTLNTRCHSSAARCTSRRFGAPLPPTKPLARPMTQSPSASNAARGKVPRSRLCIAILLGGAFFSQKAPKKREKIDSLLSHKKKAISEVATR